MLQANELDRDAVLEVAHHPPRGLADGHRRPDLGPLVGRERGVIRPAARRYRLVIRIRIQNNSGSASRTRGPGCDRMSARRGSEDAMLHMRRRQFITLIGGAAAAWPRAARTQQARLRTVGYLGTGTPSSHGQWLAAFVQRLRELGWVEGRTVMLETRWAEGHSARFAEITAEFVRMKVDVVVTTGAALLAAKEAASAVPIVFAIAADPVGSGLVAKSRAAGGQRHRPVAPTGRCRRQAPRNVARGSPRSSPVGDHGQCRQSGCRDRCR